MIVKRLLFLFVLMCSAMWADSQKIIYSEPDREDSRRMDFDIAGKIGGNFLVYKNTRGKNWITVFDEEMVQVAKVEQSYVPDNDRMINVDFFPYADYCYMVYQYQKKSIVYCMASKIGPDGKKIGDVIELDTTHLGFAANNRIYSVLTSEDKSKIMVFKINTKEKRRYVITTLLLNDKLEPQKKSRIAFEMQERNEYVNDFFIDNEGDLVFSKIYRQNNDNISKAAFVVKYADADTLSMNHLNIDEKWLDEIHIKVDNFNKRYIVSSFYFTERRGNVEGYYFYVWDKVGKKPYQEFNTKFSEELKKEAKGDATTKTAFNDYFIRDVITRKDGGYIVTSESYYTTSRFNNWNRWDYLYGSPYSYNSFNNYYYSPFYNNYYWRRSSTNQAVRYHADNIAVLSFDPKGNVEWNTIVSKSQFDDESDDLISFSVMNTGGRLHVLFNQPEKRNNLLSDYTITPDGEVNRSPTLKNLDRGYEFMPKYGKQVSARQMIVPCLSRNGNYICFAKIDFSQN